MPVTAAGVWFPSQSDSTRLWELWEQQAESLSGRTIVPVANVAARDALAAEFGPTPDKPLYVSRADAPVTLRTEWTADGETWQRLTGERSGAITVSSQWTPDGSRPLRWHQIGSMVYLSGTMTYSSSIPSNGFVTLNGIPEVGQRWDGVLRNGNANAVGAGLTTARRLEWEGKLSTPNSPLLALDGIYYRAAQ